MPRAVQEVTLVGFGAIGRSIFQRMRGSAHTRIAHIVVSTARVAALQAELGSAVQVSDQVPASSRLVLAETTTSPGRASDCNRSILPEVLHRVDHLRDAAGRERHRTQPGRPRTHAAGDRCPQAILETVQPGMRRA